MPSGHTLDPPARREHPPPRGSGWKENGCCRASVLRTTASLMLQPLSDKLRRHVDVLIGTMPVSRCQRRSAEWTAGRCFGRCCRAASAPRRPGGACGAGRLATDIPVPRELAGLVGELVMPKISREAVSYRQVVVIRKAGQVCNGGAVQHSTPSIECWPPRTSAAGSTATPPTSARSKADDPPSSRCLSEVPYRRVNRPGVTPFTASAAETHPSRRTARVKPLRVSGEGPPFEWTDAPADAAELALLCKDRDEDDGWRVAPLHAA